MSTIVTPPEDRYPVLTYVGSRTTRSRSPRRCAGSCCATGQAFYVHNRVSSIDSAAARLRELVPEAKIAVAHGQMPEDRLEATVRDSGTAELRHPGVHHDR